jgi:hypothetical protein
VRPNNAIMRARAGLVRALLLWIVACAAGAAATPVIVASHAPGPAATQGRPSPTWGLHGMLLFGGADGLFASHLPMFHAPHDFHVVIALQLASPGIDAAMRARLASTPALWTLVPEKFELARLAPGAANPLAEFKADIVEGHFERGGKTIYPGVIVRVIRTERYVQLDPHARPAATAHYLPVGQGRTWFLVKEVDARPDFDDVLMLSAAHAPAAIDVPVHGIARPADSAIQALLAPSSKLVGTVYYDTEDLQ